MTNKVIHISYLEDYDEIVDLFMKSNNKYIITHGFTKKTQKTPIREINHAITIKREYEKEIQNATRKYPNNI